MERFTPNGVKYDILKTTKRDGFYYSNGKFEYTPPGWAKIEDRWYPMGYRLVRSDLTSLGLRKNPTPLQYLIGEWTMLTKKELVAQRVDHGGIWTGASLGAARKTEQSCLTRKEDPFQPRIFYSAIYRPVFANGYGVKSQGIMLLEELK